MATIDATIDAALRNVGLIGPGHTSAAGGSSGLRLAAIDILNVMLQSWQTDGINVPCEVRQAPVASISAQSEYSVGSGGDINIPRPASISDVKFMVDGFERPLYMLTDQDYRDWPNKTISGEPSAWHYKNDTAARGTLTLLPVPSSAGDIVLYTPALFTNYSATTDNLTIGYGYDEPIRIGLALRFERELKNLGAALAPDLREELKAQYREDIARLQRLNFRPQRLNSDFPTPAGPMSQAEFESGAFLYW